MSDSNLISFKISTNTIEYGDGRKFFNYKISMFLGAKPVGIESGPHRTFLDRSASLSAARQRIRALKAHKLFVINITRKHINDGEGRNCNTCAIAQALWHNQERMGFSRSEYGFHVSPYGGMFVGARGIVIEPRYGLEADRILEPRRLPDIVYGMADNGRICNDEMQHFAMSFDDWADSHFISLAEWREMHGYQDGERPYRPSPCSFVLDLNEFEAAPVA